MIKTSLVFVLAFLYALPLFAQTVDTAWVRIYNGPGNGGDAACAIAVDSSGNVYVTGTSYDSVTSNDYATIKYYSSGDTAWVRRYNGPGNSSDVTRAMGLDPSGYVYITGGSGTVKYDAQGNQLWVDSLAGSDIAVCTSGNVYVTGGNGTIRYDSQGSRLWINSLGGIALGVDSAGNVYTTASGYITTKFYPNGDTAWVRDYTGPANSSDNPADIAVDAFGNAYVTGSSKDTTTSGGSTQFDFATIKYDTNGNEEWVRRYDFTGYDDRANAIVVDKYSNVYVTGCICGKFLWSFVLYYKTIGYDTEGNTLWSSEKYGWHDPDSWSESYGLCVDQFGRVYVTGRSDSTGRVGSWDYATLMYDHWGQHSWIRRFNGSVNSNDIARAVAVDDYGNVYVTGYSMGNGSSYDFATIKYWQNYPPDSFSLVSPSDSTVLSYAVTFNWQTSTDPDPWDTMKYDLYVSTSPSFDPDSIVIYDDLLTNQHTDTLEIGTYYWKARAYDKRSETWSNQIWTFRVQNYPPNAFSLLLPSDSAMIPYIVTFDWETATDPDPWDTAKYDLYVSTSSIFNPDSTVIYDNLLSSQHTDTLGLGRYYWKVRAYDTRLQTWSSQTWTLLSAMRGDANADKKVTVADVVYLVNFLFKNGPAPNPFQVGDVNCDGYVTVSDIVYLINYLFKGGPPPCEPEYVQLVETHIHASLHFLSNPERVALFSFFRIPFAVPGLPARAGFWL